MTTTKTPKAAKSSTPIVVSGTIKLDFMPEVTSKRGGNSQFPFDTLTEPGMAFGVKDRTVKSMSQVISTRNRNSQVNKIDAAGNVVYKMTEMKNADGSVTKVPSQEPEKVAGKLYQAVEVTPELKAKLPEELKGFSLIVIRKQ